MPVPGALHLEYRDVVLQDALRAGIEGARLQPCRKTPTKKAALAAEVRLIYARAGNRCHRGRLSPQPTTLPPIQNASNRKTQEQHAPKNQSPDKVTRIIRRINVPAEEQPNPRRETDDRKHRAYRDHGPTHTPTRQQAVQSKSRKCPERETPDGICNRSPRR